MENDERGASSLSFTGWYEGFNARVGPVVRPLRTKFIIPKKATKRRMTRFAARSPTMMGPYLSTVDSVLDELLSARFTAALLDPARASEPVGMVHAGTSTAVGVDESALEAVGATETDGVDEPEVDAEDEDDGPSKRLMISCGASSEGLFSSSSARTVAKSAAAWSVAVSASS
jgi:hypothetical protein